MSRRPERGARFYALLLRLYPARLRRERGAEMLALYRSLVADARERGPRARLRFHGRMVRDVLVSLAAEHAHALRGRRQPVHSDQRRSGMIDALLQDIRYALRTFVRAPAFTLAALGTLALGIGATTAMFGVVDAILLRPLPYAGEGALVQIGLRYEAFESGSVAPSDYHDLTARSRTLVALGASRLQWMDMAGAGEPERLDAAGVSHDFFDVLGATPVLGRSFRAADDHAGAEAVVLLSHGLWQRRFGGSPDVLGRTLVLNGEPYAVAGVMPAGFRPPEAIHQGSLELWFPLGRIDDPLDARGDAFLQLIGRVRPGVDADAARAELTVIGEQLGAEFPDVGVRNFWVSDLRDRTVGESRRMLWMLLGAVVLLLLIACANIANLWLVRATERTRELAVRSALGAGRVRVARQLLTESLLLAVAGGALGALLARAGIALFRAFAPPDIPRIHEVSLDLRVLGFAFGVSVLTGIVFGLAPVATHVRASLSQRLREAATASSTRTGHRLRGAFVATQTALALVLLVGAALLVNGFLRLTSVEPGFEPDGVAWLDVSLPSRSYASAAARQAFYDALMGRVRGLPGVTSAGAIDGMPFELNRSNRSVLAEGVVLGPDQRAPRTSLHTVIPGYFETLGIDVVQGRALADTDVAGAPLAGVVSRAFAQQLFPGDDAVGKRFRFAGDDSAEWVTVVGVVDDVRHYGLAAEPEPMLYMTFAQNPRTWVAVAMRHTGSAAPVLRAAREAVWALDPSLPLDEAGTARGLMAASLVQERFRAGLLGAFAAVALSLTFVGLYGTMSHLVRARRREMGIRLALGAAAHDVRRLVVLRGMRIAAIGLAIGVPAALVATRALAGFVFGVTTTDPATFAAVVAFLALVAFLACWIPARRAAAMDPVRTLRVD